MALDLGFYTDFLSTSYQMLFLFSVVGLGEFRGGRYVSDGSFGAGDLAQHGQDGGPAAGYVYQRASQEAQSKQAFLKTLLMSQPNPVKKIATASTAGGAGALAASSHIELQRTLLFEPSNAHHGVPGSS